MSKAEQQKEQLMEDYWLGKLSSEKVEKHEIGWYSNSEDFELLEIIREELMENYLNNLLKDEEKRLFEKNFLTNQKNLVETAKFNLDRKFIINEGDLSKTPFITWVKKISTSIFSNQSDSSFTFSTTLVTTGTIIIVIGAIAILYLIGDNSSTPTNDIVGTKPSPITPLPVNSKTPKLLPSPTSSSTNPKDPKDKENSNSSNVKDKPSQKPVIENKQRNSKETPSEENSPKPSNTSPLAKPKPIFATLVLKGTQKSSSSDLDKIQIPQNTTFLRIEFNMPFVEDNCTFYTAKILSKKLNKEIWQSSVPELKNKKNGQTARLQVSSNKLNEGIYNLSISCTVSKDKKDIFVNKDFQVQTSSK